MWNFFGALVYNGGLGALSCRGDGDGPVEVCDPSHLDKLAVGSLDLLGRISSYKVLSCEVIEGGDGVASGGLAGMVDVLPGGVHDLEHSVHCDGRELGVVLGHHLGVKAGVGSLVFKLEQRWVREGPSGTGGTTQWVLVCESHLYKSLDYCFPC